MQQHPVEGAQESSILASMIISMSRGVRELKEPRRPRRGSPCSQDPRHEHGAFKRKAIESEVAKPRTAIVACQEPSSHRAANSLNAVLVFCGVWFRSLND